MIKITTINPNNPGGFKVFLDQDAEMIKKPFVVSYGARVDDRAAGVVVVRCFDASLYIDYLGVDPSVTENVAEELIKFVIMAAKRLQLKKVYAVLLHTVNEKLMDRYLDIGFKPEAANESYSFKFEAALSTPIGRKAKISAKTINLDRVTNSELEKFNAMIGGLNNGVHNVRKRANRMIQDISFAIVEDQKMTGGIFIDDCGDGLAIRGLFGNGSMDTVLLIQSAICAAKDKYDPQTTIYAVALVPSVQQLIEKMFGNDILTKETLYTLSYDV